MLSPQVVEHGPAQKRGDLQVEKKMSDSLIRESSRRPLVAVIDDNADIVEALTEALGDRDYRVLGYRSARDALGALEQGETPSLIVFDLMMPQMDGWTFRVKQKASAKLRDVPVIVMTASGSAQAEAIDAHAYLRKPLSIERFCSTVEQTIASIERRALLARSVEIERLRALGMLVTCVAHEINNPLSYVAGNLDLVLRDCPRVLTAPDPAAMLEALRKRVENARHGTAQIVEIVRSLLIFGRAESDTTTSADLARVLDGAVHLGSAYARPRAELRCSWSSLPRVVGQEGRLGQVFLNLLMNAAQAIEPGAPERNTITISARCEDDRVIVEVSDTGCGIEAENLARVFDEFFTTKPAGEGTGIGLSFCKDVVEKSGGTIAVRSQAKVGTTFTVTLPVAAPDSEAEATRRKMEH